MSIILKGATVVRRRRGAGSGAELPPPAGAIVSAQQSSLSLGNFAFPASGAPTTITLTARDAAGSVIAGRSFAATQRYRSLSAASSLVTPSALTVPADGETAVTVTIRLVDTLTGVPLVGIPASLISVAVSGGASVTQPTQATNYNGETTASFTASTTGIKAITVTVDSVALTANPSVTALGEGGAGPYWYSDFGFATGSGVTAIRDGADSTTQKWPVVFGGQGLDVIPSTGLDFPSTNVLRHTLRTASSGWQHIVTDRLQSVPIGGSFYLRFYFRGVYPDGLTDGSTHPIESFNAEVFEFGVYHNEGGNGFYRIAWTAGDPFATVFPNYQWRTPPLTKGVTYRHELRITRTGTTSFTMSARVYNSAGALLYTDADLTNMNNTQNLAAFSGTLHATTDGFAGINQLYAGNNGMGEGGWSDGDVASYQGCFAVRYDDWCGPYVPGVG